MFKISKTDGTFLGATEEVNYIRVAANGCFVSTDARDAQGVAVDSTPYNLQGHAEITRGGLVCDEAVVERTTLSDLIGALEKARAQADADTGYLAMMCGVELDRVEAVEEEGEVTLPGDTAAEEEGEVTLPGDGEVEVASDKFDTVKGYYDAGLWSEKRVNDAVTAGWITADEAAEIIAG